MNKPLFLSTSLGCLAAVAAIFCAAPALAQGGQHVPVSGYCTGEIVQISGWENDLVRRNKGLEKFHWSAINTVQHYNIMPAGSAQRPAAKALTPYHYTKAHVTSNWSNPTGPIVDKTCIAAADNGSRASVNAHLRSANTSAYGAMSRIPEASAYGCQQARYGGERTTDNRVSARLMHY